MGGWLFLPTPTPCPKGRPKGSLPPLRPVPRPSGRRGSPPRGQGQVQRGDPWRRHAGGSPLPTAGHLAGTGPRGGGPPLARGRSEEEARALTSAAPRPRPNCPQTCQEFSFRGASSSRPRAELVQKCAKSCKKRLRARPPARGRVGKPEAPGPDLKAGSRTPRPPPPEKGASWARGACGRRQGRR